MSNRDDFSSSTKNALALRAAYRCSICDCTTVGPSDEAVDASASIGVAAHICAAARGGRRYDPDMTEAERAGFENGIWLCANDATLIDRDDVTFTVAVLKAAKARHEAKRKAAIGKSPTPAMAEEALIAIGPDIVGLGALTGISEEAWSFRISHFISGDRANLINFISGFSRTRPVQRYVLSNDLGEGRTLKGAPFLQSDAQGATLVCPIDDRFPRTRAQDLGRDFALSSTNDLFATDGDITMVSGLDALPQRVASALGLQVGERLFAPEAGSRFGAQFRLFEGSPWLDELLKLETIRQASIPLSDALNVRGYTPFQCVERVLSVAVLGPVYKRRLPVRFDFVVAGVGAWQREASIYVPDVPNLRLP